MSSHNLTPLDSRIRNACLHQNSSKLWSRLSTIVSKNSLVVKDKTRKGKGGFLLWGLTRQSPVTDCQGIFHNYLASWTRFTALRLVPLFAKSGCGWWCNFSPSYSFLFWLKFIVTYLREIITFIIHIFDTFKLDENLAEHKQLIVNYRVLMSNYCYGSVFVIKIIASSHGLKGLVSLWSPRSWLLSSQLVTNEKLRL